MKDLCPRPKQEDAAIASLYRLSACHAAYQLLVGTIRAPLASFKWQQASAASDLPGKLPLPDLIKGSA